MTFLERTPLELCRRCGAALTVIPGNAVTLSSLCFLCVFSEEREHEAYVAFVARVRARFPTRTLGRE